MRSIHRVLIVAFAIAQFSLFQLAQAQNTNKSEAELIAVLTSDAPKSEKAITCKHLAVHGTSAAVPELAKLLADEELTSWARTAPEVIPDPAAETALRNAIGELSGRSLIGVINSVGIGKDNLAVDVLIEKLDASDSDVSAAAAVALGRIGTEPARAALTDRLKHDDQGMRAIAAEGLILAAEQLLESGDAPAAATLYDRVRETEVPKQRILEATRGAIVARKSVSLLVEQLQSTDHDHFGIGVRTSRELPDASVTDALVSILDNVTPARQSVIVLSLAERDPASVLPAILRVANTGSAAVRRSAMQVLGKIGDATCIDAILKAAGADEEEIAAAARDALAALPDPSVDQQVIERLADSTGSQRLALINAVGRRRISATRELVRAADDANPDVRSEALMALGATVTPDELAILIDQLISTDRDHEICRKALLTACVRMPDRDACALELTAAMARASIPKKCELIQILGNVGGSAALKSVGAAAAADQDELKDAASRALGRWMTPDAAPVLLSLAKPSAKGKYQVRALRGYLRIARQMKLADKQRAEMCKNALKAAGRQEERLLALSVLGIHPNPQTLMVAIHAASDARISDEAKQAAVQIGSKLGIDSATIESFVRNGDTLAAGVKIIKATYGAGERVKDVTTIVQDNVGPLPFVILSNPSYNSAFGGDPAPGTVKKLVIEYEIAGKTAEASFAENSPINLPIAK